MDLETPANAASIGAQTAIDSLTKELLEGKELTIDEKIKISEQLRKNCDDVAKWVTINKVAGDSNNNQKEIIKKLDDLK